MGNTLNFLSVELQIKSGNMELGSGKRAQRTLQLPIMESYSEDKNETIKLCIDPRGETSVILQGKLAGPSTLAQKSLWVPVLLKRILVVQRQWIGEFPPPGTSRAIHGIQRLLLKASPSIPFTNGPALLTSQL